MQPRDINRKDHNLKLDDFISDVSEVGASLCRDVKSPGRATHKLKKRNIFRTISSVTFAPLHKFTTPSKILLMAFLMFSIVLHLFFTEGVYLVSQSKAQKMKKQKAEKITLRVIPPEEHQVFRKTILSKPTPDIRKATVPAEAAKKSTPEFKELPPEKLAALGQKHMDMVREGTFPALILSYRSPISYIREMYTLGAKTVVYNTVNREYHEIDLLDGGILPLSNSDFKGFSLIKRVIKDMQWNPRKVSAASRLKASLESLEILLLLPMTVEARWIGHQVNLLSQMNIKISEVQTVEAQFQDAKFKLICVHLKNGSSRHINDRGCA